MNRRFAALAVAFALLGAACFAGESPEPVRSESPAETSSGLDGEELDRIVTYCRAIYLSAACAQLADVVDRAGCSYRQAIAVIDAAESDSREADGAGARIRKVIGECG